MRLCLIVLVSLAISAPSQGIVYRTVTGLLVKHGLNFAQLIAYGDNTVREVLSRGFSSTEGQQLLSELGFELGVVGRVPSDDMLLALDDAVASDSILFDGNDWSDYRRRLELSIKIERFLSDVELDDSVIDRDRNLGENQKQYLKSSLSLKKSSWALTADAKNLVWQAIRSDKPRERLATMIERGELDVNLVISAERGETLLATIVRNSYLIEGYQQLLSWLVDRPNISFDNIDNQGRNFIHVAAKEGDLYALNLALAKGVDATTRDTNGNTPLLTVMSPSSRAKIEDRMEIARLLIEEQGVPVNDSADSGTTAFHFTVDLEARWFTDSGKFSLSKYLVEQGADVNAKSRLLGRPLDIATRLGNVEMTVFLRKLGAVGGMFPREQR